MAVQIGWRWSESMLMGGFHSIVAVHGLNGHPFKTWTSNLVDPPFNWLDQLAKDIPQFRVFTFSYNASTHASISLDDIAKDLLSDLQLVRIESCRGFAKAHGS